MGMSASTIDRLLRPYRQHPKGRSFSTTKPGTLLKTAISIRTFSEWDERCPGFLELDLVAHCGESTEGFYLNTLSAVDIAHGLGGGPRGMGQGPGTGRKCYSRPTATAALPPNGSRLEQRE